MTVTYKVYKSKHGKLKLTETPSGLPEKVLYEYAGEETTSVQECVRIMGQARVELGIPNTTNVSAYIA